MSTRIPKAWGTSWAQEAIRDEQSRASDRFRHGEEEKARIDAVLASAALPDGCSREIPVAPGRGAVDEFREGYWRDKEGKSEWRDVPYRAGCPGRARDIFDVMTDQATRRGGPSPFTAGQVGAARDYRALHERVHSSGVKCSSAFDLRTGSGGRIDFMDAYMADTRLLAGFHSAIGGGLAKDIKRNVPATVGKVVIGDVQLRRVGRTIITVRCLVDEVCIKERALSAVLEAHGWRATGKNRTTLRSALCAALGRMQGI